MAQINEVRFLLFVSLMIGPAHGLDIIISGAHHDFKQRSEIKTNIIDGEKIYGGTLNPLTYEAGVNISKVIVYIIDRSRYVEIIRNAVRETRLQIAEELEQRNCELIFLGVENFEDDEYHLIGAFMLEKIQPHPDQTDQELTVDVIGENRFDRSYQCHFVDFVRYRENAQICGGTLLARLRDIRHGALRPVWSNNKEIKLRGYRPPKMEVTWSVRVENDQYFPEVDVSDPRYNFRIKHPKKKICVLVLSGKEYSRVIVLRNNSWERSKLDEYLSDMAERNERFYIMGAFNFDWSEVYIVTQIILQHTQGRLELGYNVFACGFGMFNTNYLNWYENDGRQIQQLHKSYVLRIIKLWIREEVKERAINMHYSDNGWQKLEIPIILSNGQYVSVDQFYNFTIPWLNQRIALIVYDSTEANGPINYPMVYHSMRELERSNISVILIEAFNFELYDAHIVAEWIEWHRGYINPEQIAVLGCGTFDTIFQSKRFTYNTFFNIKKNELRKIREAYVKSGNEKKVLAARMDDENFEVWSYPMNTIVNGFYEPDLIPDKNTLDTADGRKVFFIITSANIFQLVSEIPNVGPVTAVFRRTINNEYPIHGWSVFLVGLDNFRESDTHRFTELAKMETNDERALVESVRTLSYGEPPTFTFLYKGAERFFMVPSLRVLTRITWLLGMVT